MSADRFLSDEKALACIHCGLCLAACPTYLETGNENDSPRGRIYLMRALQDGRLPLSGQTVRPIDLCLGCRACEAVCPSGVAYGELLEGTRAHIERKHRRSAFQTFLRRVAIERVVPFPRRMKVALAPVKLLKRTGLARFLPAFVRETLALVPDDSRAVNLPEVCTTQQSRAGIPPAQSGTLAAAPERQAGCLPSPTHDRVGFISGCVMSVMFGPTNLASIRLLNQAGYEVVTPKSQVCCGALYAHGGNLEQARRCARRNIEAFERLSLDAIIINAAGCGSTLKEYGHLLQHDPKFSQRARQFSSKVKDLTEWLTQAEFQVSSFKLQVAAPTRNDESLQGHSSLLTPHSSLTSPTVTYHDACHLAHAQRITNPPRRLVRALAGNNFVELPESEVCCGSAGSYNLTEPAMAARLQRRKVEHILKTGAQVVITTNPGCMLQIQAGLRKAGASHVRVLHLADYLAGLS